MDPMPPVPQPLRVAIVGAGRMAREHARAFAAVPGITVAGIHSRTRPRAEALARELGIPHVCDSIKELHGRTSAGLAVVTVPEPAMKAVALAALAQPWTLLIEKPPGLAPEETEEIAAGGCAARGPAPGVEGRVDAGAARAARVLEWRRRPLRGGLARARAVGGHRHGPDAALGAAPARAAHHPGAGRAARRRSCHRVGR